MSINYAKITAGDLRNRLTIEQPTYATDTIGGKSTTWSTFATVWGKVIPFKGMEKLFAEQPRAEVTHKVVIRFMNGLTENMRIKYTIGTLTRTLQIKAIILPNNQMRNFMELVCIEGVAS